MTTVHHQHSEPDVFRCSHGQQSLWLMDQIAPGNPAYNLHAALRTPFALLPEPLSAACVALTMRHETLRTCFDWDGYEPVQRVVEDVPSCLQMADLRSMRATEAQAELALLSQQDAATPFELGTAPLLRVGLVLMPAGRSVLLITIHHIISDAWSMNILVRDLLELYVAEVSGRAAQLPDLPIQYIDYAAWQRDQVEGDRQDALIDGWRSYLAETCELDLPSDHPRRPGSTQPGAHHRFVLPAHVSRACREHSREFAATPYALITGCFAEVLRRYGGAEDFMIGMPTAGRDRSDLEELIGFFVRTLVLRADLRGNPTFRELSQRISRSVAEALTLQDLPFERVVELVDPERDLSLNPLFRVTSQYLSNPLERTKTGSIEVVDLHRGFANFDLTLDFWEEDGVLKGRIEYARDLYEPETIARLEGHLNTLLARALQQPDIPLAQIDMLTDAEREALLGSWAEGSKDFPEDATLPELFAQIAKRYPDAPAVRDVEGDMTYADLEAGSGAIAGALIRAAIQPGEYVGIALPRTRARIVSLLGIVRAGAAYVALDPAWPDGRLRAIADTTEMKLVIAEGDADRWLELGLECMSADVPDAEGDTDPSLVRPASIAYAAFTSGSTGTPKGVPTMHRAVIRLMRGGAPFSFAPGETMLGFAPLGFDASTFEIWGPLLGGGCIALAPEGQLSPQELDVWIRKAGVTKAWLTAGLFSQMSEVCPDRLAGLQAVFAGGDVLSEQAVRRILQRGGTVINGYGPTENTVFTCFSVMDRPDAADAGIRIGRPVPGTRLRVLDPEGHPVPAGIPGELVAGGAGVSPGYLGDRAGNGRFVPDPVDPDGGTVYRTGDLVRWTSDGELEFLDRCDRQVKIRGFRIEPGEVEREIREHPGVRDCVVAVRGAGADEKALIAFVVFEDETPDVSLLRGALAGRLQAQARPSAIVPVDRLPLGENGKVDVAALLALPPLPDTGAGSSDTLTEVEDLVAETFAEILGQSSVPPDGIFFDMGGHSLHATRVVTRLRETLDIDLPLQTIFENPTVRGLAARLEDILLAEFEPGSREED
ncbi:amino acid adenylation domain-containing protein [uncultured Roseobacter sp.]|uniref:non-ribosomal peptide synthetase n=1 Tax=uncultured Roseobacter sp. TaxID=114847 RepID=UPI002606C883|nr:amino acid adenylation domain-containing protein [uncultured Roseobacter sp.]